MGISAEAVTWGYRFFLGRDPESPQAVHAHLGAKDELQLAKALMRSPEFAARRRQLGLEPITELRELAHGIFPAILAEAGLGVARDAQPDPLKLLIVLLHGALPAHARSQLQRRKFKRDDHG